MDPKRKKVVPVPVIELAHVPPGSDHDVIFIQGAYRVYGLALQDLVVADNLRADLVIIQVQQDNLVFTDVETHELFQVVGFHVVDLEAVIPQQVAIAVKADDDRVRIAVPVEHLVTPDDRIPCKGTWIEKTLVACTVD